MILNRTYILFRGAVGLPVFLEKGKIVWILAPGLYALMLQKMFLPVITGSHAMKLPERRAVGLMTGKPVADGNIGNGGIRIGQRGKGFIDPEHGQVLNKGHMEMLLKKRGKILRMKTQDLGRRGQGHRFLVGNIQVFQSRSDLLLKIGRAGSFIQLFGAVGIQQAGKDRRNCRKQLKLGGGSLF